MVDYPNDWKLESIGEIFNTITDYVAAGSFKDLSDNVKYYNSPNYAQLIRTRDIKSKFKNRGFIFIDKQAYDYLWRVHFDDTKIIMPNIGNCGEVYFVEVDKLPHERCVLGPNAIMLFDTDNDMKFIYYVLQRNDFQKDLKDIISPSGQTKFNKTDLSKIKIRIPADILEQKHIAEALMAFDRHIENLERLIEKKKMLRDGAVEDFMTGKTRLDGFDGEWEEKSIECITSQIITGGTPSTIIDSYWNGDIPWLSSTEIHQKNIKRPTKFITSRGLEESSAKIAPKYSVLVALAGQGKTRGTAGYLLKDMALNQSLAALVCKNSLSSKFLFYWIDYRYDFLRELSSGDGGRGGLNKKLIMKIKLTIPTDIKEQEAIASILTSMDEEIENLKKEKAKIEKIKDGAMDDLLTGRVRLI